MFPGVSFPFPFFFLRVICNVFLKVYGMMIHEDNSLHVSKRTQICSFSTLHLCLLVMEGELVAILA